MNQNLQDLELPKWERIFIKVLLFIILISILGLIFIPWQQTSHGQGVVTAFSPNDRIQAINATVDGRIKKWYVSDGAYVKKDKPIVEIVDNDPNYIVRLKLERDAVLKNYEAYKTASETAHLNLLRQKELFEKGLSARTKLEKAQIEYQKLISLEASAAAKLAKAEVKLSRQQRQLILAPRDGTILKIHYGSGSVQVKKGQHIATFVPDSESNAVEIYVDGNDLPLIQKGVKVRLQFEGWPAVQFSGWPSVAIGTFGGIVKSTDPSVSSNGKFRVIVVPSDEKWPDTRFLRQGTRVMAWFLLNQVKLGYELWRMMNGFPIGLSDDPRQLGPESKKNLPKKNYK